MDAREFINHLPQNIKNQIIAESNAPVLETEENLIDAITEDPEKFSGLIWEYEPEWAAEMWGDETIKKAMSIIGSIRTAKKAASSRENGKLGGRPKSA